MALYKVDANKSFLQSLVSVQAGSKSFSLALQFQKESQWGQYYECCFPGAGNLKISRIGITFFSWPVFKLRIGKYSHLSR